MSDEFKSAATIKVIYFVDEEVKSKRTVFNGSLEKWRTEVGENWNGFEEGDRFLLNKDKVRVFSISETFDPEGKITQAIYNISSMSLNPNRIQYNKLN